MKTRVEAQAWVARLGDRPAISGNDTEIVARRKLHERWSLYMVSAGPGALKVGITIDVGAKLRSLPGHARLNGYPFTNVSLLGSIVAGDYWDARLYEDAIVKRCRPFTLAKGPQRSEWFEDRPFVRELFGVVVGVVGQREADLVASLRRENAALRARAGRARAALEDS